MIRVLDLFSGIGGFSLGLQMAGGFQTVQFVEIEPFCQKVLAKNFPGIPIHDDVRTFRPAVGAADLVCGGFPCQPFSHAGKRRGKADDRDLWPEMRRVIETVRPAWVIGENVAGFVNMELDRSLSDLEALGYSCQAFVIPACAVAAPHRRDRVWIVGHAAGAGRDSTRSAGGTIPESRTQQRFAGSGGGGGAGVVADSSEAVADTGLPERRQINQSRRRMARNDAIPQRQETTGESGERCEAVANRPGDRLEGQREGRTAPWAVNRSGNGRDPCEWEPESSVGGMVDGLSRQMDGIVDGNEMDGTETGTTGGSELGTVRDMRRDRIVRTTSSGLQRPGPVRGSLSDLPYQSRSAGRPPRSEEAKGVQGVRHDVYTTAHEKTQHLQSRMSFGDWSAQRNEAVVWRPESGIPRVATGVRNRIDRLRGLGNAVVPQIIVEIGRAIITCRQENEHE